MPYFYKLKLKINSMFMDTMDKVKFRWFVWIQNLYPFVLQIMVNIARKCSV